MSQYRLTQVRKVHAPYRGAIGSGDWRNPCYAVRVALVGAVWTAPGALVGLLTALFIPVPFGSAAVALLGAALGGLIGVGMESLVSDE